MPYKEIITNSTAFQVYSFDAIFEAIQPYLKDGFKFDMQSNEGYPQQIGTISTFCIQEFEKVDVEYPVETSVEPEVAYSVDADAESVAEVKPQQEPKTRRAKNQG